MVTCVHCQEGKLPRLRIDSLTNQISILRIVFVITIKIQDMPVVGRGSFVVAIVAGDVLALVVTATQLQ